MGMMPTNTFDSSNPSGSPTGSSSLDGPPPHMAPRPAGADTAALQGRDTSGGAGPLAMNPRAKVIAALAMLMQGANLIESIMPGAMSPQFLMELDNMRMTLPQAVDQLASQASPLGLLSAIGSALAPGGGMGAGPGMNPGMPSMPSIGQSAGMPGGGGQPPQQQ